MGWWWSRGSRRSLIFFFPLNLLPYVLPKKRWFSAQSQIGEWWADTQRPSCRFSMTSVTPLEWTALIQCLISLCGEMQRNPWDIAAKEDPKKLLSNKSQLYFWSFHHCMRRWHCRWPCSARIWPHVANQPSRHPPLLHPMPVLTPQMALLARQRLSGPPTLPMAPTHSRTTMEEMGGCSSIPPLFVN